MTGEWWQMPRRSGLLRKITALSSGLVLLSVTTMAVFVAKRQAEQDLLGLQTYAQTMAQVLSSGARTLIRSGNEDALLDLVQGLEVNPDLAYLLWYDKVGSPLGDTVFGERPPVRLHPDTAMNGALMKTREVHTEGHRYLDVVVPIRALPPDDRTTVGFVQFGLSFERVDAATTEFLLSSLGFTVALLAVALALTFILAQRMIRPISQLVEATQSVRNGNLDEDVRIDAQDDIAELVNAFDDMRSSLRVYRDNTNEIIDHRTRELQRASQAALAAAEQAKTASESKSVFLAKMTHELRTPLNAIIGFGSVLADGHFGKLNDEQSMYLNDILSSGRHLAALVNDILDVSRIEAGKTRLKLQAIPVKDALEEVARLTVDYQKNALVNLFVKADDAPHRILADPRMFRQVFLNLFTNAVKFSHRGSKVYVEADEVPLDWVLTNAPELFTEEVAEALVGASEDQHYVRVVVRDHGSGIDPGEHRQIFQAFQQAEGNKAVEGTGLGLTLCQRIAELHRGCIWVESELGRGSQFSVFFPQLEADEAIKFSGQRADET